jgi:hypothetical protein
VSAIDDPFQRSILMQIEINRARTPAERFQALCDLLDTLSAMMPTDSEAIDRRRRVAAVRARDRENSHAQWRRLYASQWSNSADGV